MISNPKPWQDDLIKLGSKLERRYNQKRWLESSFRAVEKEVFIGFYIIRKLIESKKVSFSVTQEPIDVTVYPILDEQKPSIEEWNRIYDLTSGQNSRNELKFLCNQFIHSSIFSPFVPFDTSLVGIFVSSDKHKGKTVFYVTLHTIIDVFKSVGNDYLYKTRVNYQRDTGRYEIVQV